MPAAPGAPGAPDAPGAPETDRRADEHETLRAHATWLRVQADTIATTEPLVRYAVAAVRSVPGALATELLALGETARVAVGNARDAVEDLAAELEQLARRHRHASRHRPARALRAAAESPTLEEVARLVADVATDLPRREARKCRKRLARARDAELSLLGDLVDAGLTHDQLLRVLEGGHLLMPGHHLLERWRKLPGVQPRTSSHYHPDDRRLGRGPAWVEAARARLHDAHAHPVYGQQYGLRGRCVHEVLFGPGPHHTTFVQLERAAPSPLLLPRHIADWVRYRITHRNQGPYGSSVDTDAHPLRAQGRWKPKRSDQQRELEQVASESDRIVRTLLGVRDALDANGRLQTLVWRGPATETFDDEVTAAITAITRSAAAVSAFGAHVRRAERLV